MTLSSRTMTGQRGMAIISALLIAAVVAVIAAGMLTRQSLLSRSHEAEQARVRGSAVLLGALETSRQLLWDARRHEVLTRLDQPWAQPIERMAPFTSADGFEGRLEDQQGKFNLRNLVANDQVDGGQLRSFERLCEIIGIDVALARRISQRVIVSYPRLLTPPAMAPGSVVSARATSPNAPGQTLPATRPMLRSLEELRGIDGLDDRQLARLESFVSILPVNTWVNGNTASAEVLAAAVPGLSLARAQALVAERDHGQWFINRGDFVNRVRLPQLSVDALTVGITSEWFLFHGRARQAQRRVSLEALLHRPEDDLPRVIWSRPGA